MIRAFESRHSIMHSPEGVLDVLSFFDEFHGFPVRGRTYPAGRNPGLRFCSEVPDDAAAGENIVLAALACVHIQLRYTRPEVSTFTAEAEVPREPHIESQPSLQYTGGGPRRARARARISTEMAESTTKTDPRRDCLLGKDIQSRRGSDKVGPVAQEWVGVGVHVLIGVYYERDLQGEGQELVTHDAPGIIYLEGQSLAEAQVRIIRGGTLDALIADEGTPKDARRVFLVAVADQSDGQGRQILEGDLASSIAFVRG